jgi:hypothetical protein
MSHLASGPAAPNGSTRSRRFPRVSVLGVVTMLFGIAFDLVEHTLVSHAGEGTISGFSVGQHAAHLVVIVGMVLVLGGIVADGVRVTRGGDHKQRSKLDAIR